MRGMIGFSRLPALLAVVLLGQSQARGDDIPIGTLRYWQFYNDSGWNYIKRGNTSRPRSDSRWPSRRSGLTRRATNGCWLEAIRTCPGALYHQGRYAEAEPLARWWLSVREANMKANPDAIFQSLYTLAMIDAAQAHYDEAESLLKRAIELQEQAIGPNHVQTAATVHELAGICVEQRKFKDAERLYKRAVAIHEKLDPDENLELAAVAEHYAALLKKLDRPAEAEKWLARAAAIKHTVDAREERNRARRVEPKYQGFK